MKNILAYVAVGALLLNGIVAAGYFAWMSMEKKDVTVAVVTPQNAPPQEIPPSGEEDLKLKIESNTDDLKPNEEYRRKIEVGERITSKETDKPPRTMMNGGDRDADRGSIRREKAKVPACKNRTVTKRPPVKKKQLLCQTNCNGNSNRRGSNYNNSRQVDLF